LQWRFFYPAWRHIFWNALGKELIVLRNYLLCKELIWFRDLTSNWFDHHRHFSLISCVVSTTIACCTWTVFTGRLFFFVLGRYFFLDIQLELFLVFLPAFKSRPLYLNLLFPSLIPPRCTRTNYRGIRLWIKKTYYKSYIGVLNNFDPLRHGDHLFWNNISASSS